MAKLWLTIALAAFAGTCLAQAPEAPAAVPTSPEASSPGYALSWVVLDASGGGGAESSGYEVELTLGQSPIGSSSGPGGRAELGFWSGTYQDLLRDDFESGNTSAWSSTVGGP